MATSRLGLAAVLLHESRLRSAKAYCEAVQQMFPELPVSILESSQSLRVLKVGESEVYLPLQPPYPWQDLVSLTETSWHWKESRELLRLHNAHILVTLRLGPDDPVDRALMLSKITAAILQSQECVGVYWHGPAISSAAMFLSAVREAMDGGRMPLLCWLTFGLVAEEAGIAVTTQGMDELGHPELEILADPEDGSAFEYTLALCNQMLKKGPVPVDGEKIGRMPGERFPVLHRRSSWDGDRAAIEIDMRKNSGKSKSIFKRLFGK